MKPSGNLTLRAITLVAAAIGCGSMANLMLPSAIPWVGDWEHYIEAKALEAGISLANVHQAFDMVRSGRYVVLDARSATDYETGHIPGAMSLPREALDESFGDVEMFLSPELPILTYCSGLECEESLEISVYLLDMGFTNIVLFAGGIRAWEAAGYGLEGP